MADVPTEVELALQEVVAILKCSICRTGARYTHACPAGTSIGHGPLSDSHLAETCDCFND